MSTRPSLYFKATDPAHLAHFHDWNRRRNAFIDAVGSIPPPADGFKIMPYERVSFHDIETGIAFVRTTSSARVPAGWRELSSRGLGSIIRPRRTKDAASVAARAWWAEHVEPIEDPGSLFGPLGVSGYWSGSSWGTPGINLLGDDLYVSLKADAPAEVWPGDGWERVPASTYWAAVEADEEGDR